ncbi:MAG: hypothetical protein ABR505_07365 [Actinomycetota bacterium]
MAESFQRDGVWWNQQADGSWLRWDEVARQWQPSPGPPSEAGPPPPPAPPPTSAATSPLPTPGTTQPLGTPGTYGPAASPAARAPSTPTAPYGTAPSPSRIDVLAPSAGGGLRQNRTVLVVAGVVLVAGLAFAGVTLLGGDGDTDIPDIVPPEVAPMAEERAEFIAKADAICAQLNAASAALPQPKNRKQLIDRIKKGRAISVAAVKKLRSLDYPAADRPIIRQLFALSDRGLALLSKGLRAAQRGDQRAFVRATRRSLALGQRFNAIATEYGFQECNKDA